MSTLSRKMINALLPKGTVWTPSIGDDFDKYLEGQAENIDPLIIYLSALADIQTPQKTTLLNELERQYGITKNDTFSEQKRRDFLEAITTYRDENGSDDDLETRLQDAGFPVQVHSNDPASDPRIVLDQTFAIVADDGEAFAGNQGAFARRVGGELIVNGEQFIQVPAFLVFADGPNAFAGNEGFLAGFFNENSLQEILYEVPSDPNKWPFMFYIGGDATVDGNGKIIKVDIVNLPIEERNEYFKIVLQYKPLYTWAISVVDFS